MPESRGYIKVTLIPSKSTPVPGFRLQTRHIIGYLPTGTGSTIHATGQNFYEVRETPEQLDQKIRDVPHRA